MNKISETITENIFREFYGSTSFIEKSSINNSYGFKSKKNTNRMGYPDFLKETEDYVIIVEAKPLKHSDAEEEVQFYMKNNNIDKSIIGIALSGQHISQLKVTYYYRTIEMDKIEKLQVKDKLLTLDVLRDTYLKRVSGETVTDDELIKVLKQLNSTLHEDNKIRSSERSIFFSGLMIALTNGNFRNTYRYTSPPSKEEIASTDRTLFESVNLNEAIINAIDIQLKAKINNMSKTFNWKDKFSFIRNVDYSLKEYIEIIKLIENKIYVPFSNEEKQDILGKAYKIFLSRAGKAETKNIILTPDHIKELMVKLARLTVDDVVLDTCTGSGGFLMESMEMLETLAKDDIEKINHIHEKQLIGFEVDDVLFTLACSNMFLHGDGRSNLLYRDSLLHHDSKGNIMNNKDEDLFEYIRSLKPTKCIINPPYEKKNPIDFTYQALNYLENNGKLIIIMPTPTLTKYKDTKTKDILDIAKLDFVIKMPLPLFTEQKRTVNTSIFGFTKVPHNYNDEVLFYNMSDDGFVSIQHKGRIDVDKKWSDIESSVIDSVTNKKEIKGLSKKKKIYQEVIDEEGNISYELHPSGFEKITHDRPMVRLGDLFYFENGSLQSTKNDDSGEYEFVTASDERKRHTEYTHDTEALVYAVSASGSLGKSQYINGKFIASSLTNILTVKENPRYPINIKFYNYMLNSIRPQIVDDLANGTSKLTLSQESLKDYYVEYIDLEKQNEFVEKFFKEEIRIKEEMNKFEEDIT
ncbi:restriction endonuclease, partial [Staphylococcus pseudintermedius]|nr:restriction endonuclease [Staphylococcus pseudintermedius]